MADDNYTGVTTGTVATACSLAALDAILDTPDIACVKVETPKKTLDIIIDSCKKISDVKACAAAHKNPYNDPDVTVDLEIFSTVELFDKTDEEDNVIITGGKGRQNHKAGPSDSRWGLCNQPRSPPYDCQEP